jgi:hypothetical protein
MVLGHPVNGAIVLGEHQSVAVGRGPLGLVAGQVAQAGQLGDLLGQIAAGGQGGLVLLDLLVVPTGQGAGQLLGWQLVDEVEGQGVVATGEQLAARRTQPPAGGRAAGTGLGRPTAPPTRRQPGR